MKKVVSVVLIAMLIIMFTGLPSYALGFTVDINADRNTASAGSTITVTLSTNNLNIGGKGMNVFYCVLDYDKTVFEEITSADITGLNGWSVSYNSEKNKLLLDNSSFVNADSELCKITFKLKENVEIESTDIKILNPKTSNNSIDIEGVAGSTTINIRKISSDKYDVTDNTITKITPNTTIDTIKDNLVGGDTITIIDKNGNSKTSGNVATGDKAVTKTGEEYTLIVTGDINGDGKLSVTDLSQLKLHIVELTLLQEPYKSAGDINYDGKISVTDLSKLKLILVGLDNL